MRRSSIAFDLCGTLIGLVVLAGFIGFSFSYEKVGQKESLDFIWQLITFNFILATLCLTFTSSILSETEKRGISGIGLLFLFSGVAMIAANGLFATGDYGKWEPLKLAGVIVFLLAEVFISCSISLMTMIFLDRIFRKGKAK